MAVSRETAEVLTERHDVEVHKVRQAFDLKGIGRTRIAVLRRIETAQEAVDDGQETPSETV